MARDGESTKRRIYEAAVREFAHHGLHGTTIDRIARLAEVNRERVYGHFGDKAALFAAVVRTETEKVANAVPLHVVSAVDVGDFAGRTFDYQQRNPDLARLLLWEGLAGTAAAPVEPARSRLYAGKVAEVTAAQQAGRVSDFVTADHLIFLVISMASHWAATPLVARMLSGASQDDTGERDRRRAAVVHAARRLAEPAPPTS